MLTIEQRNLTNSGHSHHRLVNSINIPHGGQYHEILKQNTNIDTLRY